MTGSRRSLGGTLSDIKSPQSPASNIPSPRYQTVFLSPLHQLSVSSSSINQFFSSFYLSRLNSSFTSENSCLFEQSIALAESSSTFTIGDTIIHNITNLYLSYIHTMSGSWYCVSVTSPILQFSISYSDFLNRVTVVTAHSAVPALAVLAAAVECFHSTLSRMVVSQSTSLSLQDSSSVTNFP